MKHLVFIGLGSNLENPEQQILQAFDELNQLENTSLQDNSSLYSSKPMGPTDQPDYINAVVSLETSLTPLDLLDKLQSIENNHQRIRAERWGARTLDLDILLYAQKIVDNKRLTIPHPGIKLRSFVLYPLAEIAPNIIIPGLGKVELLLKDLLLDDIKKISVK